MARSITVTPKQQLADAGLTERQTECLAMYYFDGLTQREIATRLGVVKMTVCEHIAAARKKLAAAGMKASRLEMSAWPQIHSMDPGQIDRLGPADVRGVW